MNSEGVDGDTSPCGFSGQGPVAISAKKWRSAYWHEVRVKDDGVRSTVGSRDRSGRRNDTGNIFRSLIPRKGNSPSEPITADDILREEEPSHVLYASQAFIASASQTSIPRPERQHCKRLVGRWGCRWFGARFE